MEYHPAVHSEEATIDCKYHFFLIRLIVSFTVINTKALWTMNKLSSCTDPFISLSDSFVMKLVRSAMRHNFYIAVEDFSSSAHISPYLEIYIFFAFLRSLKEEGGGSPVELEDLYHKFGQSLE